MHKLREGGRDLENPAAAICVHSYQVWTEVVSNEVLLNEMRS
jgi:hypothetical protein